jgi:putative transposase
MRYPDGGGLTADGRARREALRLQAAGLFTDGVGVSEIAARLRVSQNAVYVWRRRWTAGGVAALRSRGPAGATCRLSDGQLERLRVVLDAGPAAHGWTEDRRWTLARVAAVIGRMFHVRYTLRGVSLLLHRIGYSPQVPARRAIERDEAAVTSWRREAWVRGKP